MRYMLLLFFTASYFPTNAQLITFKNNAKIYLVRHAEKLTGDDPLLTIEGNKRAGDLMRALKDKEIERIYITEYKRTQHTGDSLRIQLGIDTVHYLSDTSCIDLMSKLKANQDLNRTILIIGHSNTLPTIIRKLGLLDYAPADIPSNEFDNLFLMKFKKGTPSLTKMKFGEPSGASAMMK